jgi:putative hemolysin
MDVPAQRWLILIFLLSLIFEFFFTIFTSAFSAASDSDLSEYKEKRPAFYKRGHWYQLHPSILIKTYTFLSVLMTVFAAYSCSSFFVKVFEKNDYKVLWSIVCIIASMLIFLSLSVYVPYFVGTRRHENLLYSFYPVFRFFEIIFTPLIFVSDFIAGIFARIFHVNIKEEYKNVTEEDVISLVNNGQEKGVFLQKEAEMIQNIFEFDDKDAKDIMVHRNDICALDGETKLRDAVKIFNENSFSRMPVYLEDLDNIIGILHMREVLLYGSDEKYLDEKIRDIDGILQDCDFVPETHGINTIFSRMQNKKLHMVIVIDEYGQTSGLISMEDILEEIVGNIEDEHDDEKDSINKLSSELYTMSGKTPLSEVSERFGIDFGETDIETISGYLIMKHDSIPKDHSAFNVEIGDYIFHVKDVEGGVITSISVKKKLAKENLETQPKE